MYNLYTCTHIHVNNLINCIFFCKLIIKSNYYEKYDRIVQIQYYKYRHLIADEMSK